MNEYNFKTPLKENDLKNLRVGDKVYLTGTIYAGRDATLIRIIDKGEVPPVNFQNSCVFFAGPVVRKFNKKYEIISVGPTTIKRMERFIKDLFEKFQIKAVIAKGALSEESAKLIKDNIGCYLSMVGGASALITKSIECVEDVYFEDLIPECFWVLKVHKFGPCFVTVDTLGNTLHLTGRK